MTTKGVDRLVVDTNILIHATNRGSAWHQVANDTLQNLHSSGVEIVVSVQILREYLAAGTRVAAQGAARISGILQNAEEFRRKFTVIDDTVAGFDQLLHLLRTITASGKQVHDANIVATMLTHGITHLLTHNVGDFQRFAGVITIEPLVSP